MTPANLCDSVEGAIRMASLSCHEEELTALQRREISDAVNDLFHRFISAEINVNGLPHRSLARFLLVIFGCFGNSMSTNKIVTYNSDLLKNAQKSVNIVMSSFGVSDVHELLKTSFPNDASFSHSSLFDLVLCEGAHILSQLGDETSVGSLNKGPLFRDALIWLTNEARYPLLCDNRQICILHPLALQLIEDYRHQLKMLGLKMLIHLAHEVLTAAWRSSRRADVTLETLMCHRSTYSESAILAELVYKCIWAFICLLEPTPRKSWNSNFIDMLLCDLALETRLDKKTVILKHIYPLLDVIEEEILVHSRRLLRGAELTLLAPRAPPNEARVNLQEHRIFLLQLDILKKYVDFASGPLFPDIIPMVMPLLVAFTDLEFSGNGTDLSSPSVQDMIQVLADIFNKLATFDVNLVLSILNKCTAITPSINYVLCACDFT